MSLVLLGKKIFSFLAPSKSNKIIKMTRAFHPYLTPQVLNLTCPQVLNLPCLQVLDLTCLQILDLTCLQVLGLTCLQVLDLNCLQVPDLTLLQVLDLTCLNPLSPGFRPLKNTNKVFSEFYKIYEN